MISQIKEEIIELFKAIGETPPAEFSTPPKPEMGDIAIPLFNAAKSAGKSPVDHAKTIAEQLGKKLEGKDSVVSKVAAYGPYLNIFLKNEKMAELILKELKKKGDKYGFDDSKKKEKIMVEYSQPNTHKEFHIGHVRNAVIGSFVVNLLRSNGYKTVSANYIGDIGAHVAKCLWYIKKTGAGVSKSGKGRWLGQMYAEASKMIEEKPELKTEVAEVQQKLEAGDKEWVSFWKETKDWSMEGFKRIYKILEVEFDEWFFESEVEKPGKKMVEELLKKGIAKKGEGGAVIVDLSEYGLDIFLILKSDGTSLYATKDLALAQEKFKRFKIDKSIYIVDNRQRQYFKQLFKTLELMGWKKDTVFLGYDFVTLPSGAMSSRKGNVVLFDDLHNEVLEYLRKETVSRHPDWEAKQVDETVEKLALSAIKFDMLKHPIDKIITFDVKEAASFDGFSGPYLLYVIARINSLEEKAKKEGIKIKSTYKNLSSPEERSVLMYLADSEDVIRKSLEQYNSSVIARYAFELAQAFNDFYNKHSIIKAESAELAGGRLSLALAVRQVLKNMLSVLNIEIVDEM